MRKVTMVLSLPDALNPRIGIKRTRIAAIVLCVAAAVASTMSIFIIKSTLYASKLCKDKYGVCVWNAVRPRIYFKGNATLRSPKCHLKNTKVLDLRKCENVNNNFVDFERLSGVLFGAPSSQHDILSPLTR